MSEIRTNLIVSGESSEYRGNINISVITLNSNLVDTQSSFRTNIEVSLNIDNDIVSSIKTNLELNNVALDFYLVDMTKLNQSILYFSKFFNMNFEPELMWEMLAQGTNEQINTSHLSDALSNYVKISSLDNIYNSITNLENTVNSHITNSIIHLTSEEKDFIKTIMITPPWSNASEESSTESLFEIIDIGKPNNPQYAVVPKDFNGKHVHIVSYGDILAGGQEEIGGSGGNATTLGGLNNVDDNADEIFNTDKVLVKTALNPHWRVVDLSSIVGLDVNALNSYLIQNNYTTITDVNNAIQPVSDKVNSFDERIDTLENLGLTVKEHNGKKYLESEYDFIGLGDIVAGGGELGEDDEKNGTLGSLYNVDEGVDEVYPTDKVLIKSANKAHWSAFDLSSIVGLDTTALQRYLDNNKYITESALNGYATADSVNALRTDFDNLNALLNDDTSGVIDTWNEVVDFLNGYKESEDLATILSGMNTEIGKKADKTALDTLAAQLNELGLRIETIDGVKYLFSANTFVSEKDVIAGGIGTEGPDAGGIIQQVYGASAFGGSFDADNLTETFNAHAINSLYKDIQILKNSGGGGVADSIDWINVYNKPTTLGGYGITDALSTSGGVLNGDLTIGDAGNSAWKAINFNRNGTSAFLGINSVNELEIGFHNGYLKVSGASFNYTTPSGNHTVLHSDNYSSYALPLSGGTITGNLFANGYIGMGNYMTTKSHYLFVRDNANADWIVTNRYWSVEYTLIHSGNIGSYNAGSATKLQTARSIWGQSFDGTGDVWGRIGIRDSAALYHYTPDGNGLLCYIGHDYVNPYAHIYNFRSGSSIRVNDDGNICIPSGNVLIGATSDNGAKLQVNGNATYSNAVYIYDISTGVTRLTQYTNNNISRIYAYNENTNSYADLYIGRDDSDAITIKSSGNILIGTTTDNGGKLQVEGAIPNLISLKRTTNGGGAFIDYTATNASSRQWRVGASGKGAFVFEDSSETVLVSILGNGNVLMGTAYDYGYKLTVNGKIGARDNITILADAGYYHFSPDGATLYTYVGHTKSYACTWLYNGISGGAVVLYDTGGINLTQSTTISGNLTATGDITAGSDVRYKAIQSHAEIDIETIANAPVINYKWTDREDVRVHLGSTAQYWANTNLRNGVIPTTDDSLWTMNYGTIALGAVVNVAKKVVNHEERITALERENEMLKQELKQYRR